jgi:hypothetical protein
MRVAFTVTQSATHQVHQPVRVSGVTFGTFCSIITSSIACNKIHRINIFCCLLVFKSADSNYTECVQRMALVCCSFCILLMIELLYQVKKLYKVLRTFMVEQIY